MRTAKVERVTKETNITCELSFDKKEQSVIETGIPFLNHMLDAFSFYANMTLKLNATGDILIDDHHTVEDIGIVLGTCFNQALGDKIGIARFSSNLTPMDESLVQTVLDISNRPKLVFNSEFKREQIGGLSLENINEFLYAFVIEARITLHINVLYGNNDHHKVEAIFKSLGRAIKDAVEIKNNQVVSTKGIL
jgi:imidazoleglycerol-phosphate dehydratase